MTQAAPEHQHVVDATLTGIRAAIAAKPSVSHLFSWESTERGPALLFLGTGLVSKSLDQNTWFEFDEGADTVRYVVRLLELPEGDNRGLFHADVSMEEAAQLVSMCLEQALASEALKKSREDKKPWRSW